MKRNRFGTIEWRWAGVGATLYACLFSMVVSGCSEKPAPPPPAPPKVTVAHPQQRNLVDEDVYNGWLEAVENVDVRARVRGHIAKVAFTDGQIVKKGDLLFQLDPRPFEAEVGRSRDELRVVQAQKVAADRDYERMKELVVSGAVSKTEADKSEARALSLAAQVEASKQEIERKELDVEYARITAPISGRVSRAQLTVGNLVNAGGTDPVLTTIVSIDPIYLYFNIDERSLQRYQKTYQERIRQGQGLKQAKFPFSFGLDSDEGYPNQGVLDFANNRVDAGTGTIQVRGVVANPQSRFVPGSRVRVRIPFGDPYQALLVPDIAILTDQDKKYLFFLNEKNIVYRRDVKPGRLLDDGMRVVSAAGKDQEIKLSDWVIVNGLQRARINSPVEPMDNTGKPIAQAQASEAQPGPATKSH
ncbi:MAG TPA: efflux RND transporter periplasmic adaptor subunit [Terriglobales bacterium]|nr:efflux RND transporter periplasmic adaptor subunit [Terriglobales bacterium]